MFFYCWSIKSKAQTKNALRCAFLYGDFTIISYTYDLLDADSGRQSERSQRTACAICCAAARTAIHRALARDRLSLRFAQRRFRAIKRKVTAHYLRDSVCPAAPGNPRRGFPTIKQSAGLFYLPSCAFHRNEISPCAHGDQRRRLWIGPPLKRRAKLHFRAGSLQKHSAFLPDRNIHQS